MMRVAITPAPPTATTTTAPSKSLTVVVKKKKIKNIEFSRKYTVAVSHSSFFFCFSLTKNLKGTTHKPIT